MYMHLHTYIFLYTYICFSQLCLKLLNWEQPNCPSTSEQINKLYFVHTKGILFKKNINILNNMHKFQKH